MQKKSYTFNSTNRQQLINIIRDISFIIRPNLLQKQENIVMSLTGDFKCGKSLVWDTIKDTLLKNIHKNEKFTGNALNERAFERWIGQLDNNQIHMFFCNLASANGYLFFRNKIEPTIKSLAQDKSKAQTLGDLVIINNGKFKGADINIDIRCPIGDCSVSWSRRTVIKIKNPNLIAQSTEQQTLEHHYATT